MITKSRVSEIIIECLQNHNGRASILEVSQYIWDNYENELRESGKIFYTWQYEMRWETTKLRKQSVLKNNKDKTNVLRELV